MSEAEHGVRATMNAGIPSKPPSWKPIANAVLYNVAWFVGVWGAARGWVWLGPGAMALVIGLHLAWVPAVERWAELGFLLWVGALGWGLDSGLRAIGVLDYPTSENAWGFLVAPPWILALWLGFGTMPRFSLAWLRRFGWPAAAVLGAIGGVLAFLGGSRMGAIEAGYGGWSLVVLGVEYALVTPWMVCRKPGIFMRSRG